MKKIFIMLCFVFILFCVQRTLIVEKEPPPPMKEVHTPSPGPNQIWIDGHWEWKKGGYVWVPGHWVKKPKKHSVWVPGHWKKTRKGWIWVPGHWK